MRNFWDRIHKMLNLSGRGWGIFLLSLLLSFTTWVIHTFSLHYNVYLTVEVIAESNIEDRANLSSPATEIMARCRASGWVVLGQRFFQNEPVQVKFPASVLQHEEDDRYYITSEKLTEYVGQLFDNNVTVENFVTDRHYFRFREETSCKVPVKAVTSLTFDDQFMPSGSLTLLPDSILVYGDKLHLDAINHVTTATIKRSSINEDFSGMISLTPINGLRFSTDEVHYKMDVSRYLEVDLKGVPVKISGAPAGKEFETVPSAVDVVLNVQFPLKEIPDKNVVLYVDYDDLGSSLSGLVSVKPEKLPLSTLKYSFSPVAVGIREKVE